MGVSYVWEGRVLLFETPPHLAVVGGSPQSLQFIIKSACDTINTATNTMGTNPLEIKGRQVLGIKTISTKNPYNVDKDHKFYGKTYNVYQYDGTVFTVGTDDEFVNWKDAGRLYSVKFDQGLRDGKDSEGNDAKVAALQLLSCTNIDQEVFMAQTEATLNKIYKEVDAAPVTDSIMDAITA